MISASMASVWTGERPRPPAARDGQALAQG